MRLGDGSNYVFPRARREAYEKAAEKLGLTMVGPSAFGVIDGMSVAMEPYTPAVAAWTGQIPKSAIFYTHVMFEPRHGEGVIGDTQLENRFNFRGHPVLLLAWLPAEVRRALLAADRAGTKIMLQSGVLQLNPIDGPSEWIEHCARLAMELAVWFSCTSDQVAERLGSTALHDPLREVRFNALKALTQYYPATPLASSVCLHLVESTDEDLATVAAMELGYPAALDSALSSTNAVLKDVAATFVTTRDVQPGLGSLLRALEEPVTEKQAELFISAIGALEHQEKENALLKLLRQKKKHLAIPAAKELGKHGTPAALAALATRGGSSALEDAIEEATAAIIQRYRLSENTGAVSLLAEQGGELSVPREGGALSKV